MSVIEFPRKPESAPPSAEPSSEPLHVVELRTENVKRLRAVRIRPSGSTVILGGRNAQGKSSVLDSIEMALGGGHAIPADPIRHGARRAIASVNLGELTIERTFTSSGSQLVVKDRDGVKQSSPQAILDKLLGESREIAFDPLAFARMATKDQEKLLKQLVGLDFTEIDRKRAALYENRSDMNRDAKRAEALAQAMPHHPNVEPGINVKALQEELQSRNDARVARQSLIAAAKSERDGVETMDRQIADVRVRISGLEAELARLHSQLDDRVRLREEQARVAESAEQAITPEVSCDDLLAKLASAEATNAKVRENRARREAEKRADELRARAEDATEAITRLDDDRAAMIAGARFPVEGLGFGEHGPTLNGVPLEQASSAERLRLSVAIGAALNPRVKIMLVRDGSLLDDDSMKLLAELAEQSGSQVWIERVGNRDPSAVIIEDGEVLEDGPL